MRLASWRNFAISWLMLRSHLAFCKVICLGNSVAWPRVRRRDRRSNEGVTLANPSWPHDDFKGFRVMETVQYVEFLEGQANKYRTIVEEILGPFDCRFVFGTIKKSIHEDDVPHTNFPGGFHLNGSCVVDIHISSWPWEHCSPDQGPWQVAHESVHLLDPGVGGSATFLEEGLGTWFQDEPQFHTDAVRAYIERGVSHPQNYEVAKELVGRCMPKLVPVVKDIRSQGVRIREITADTLSHRLPTVDREAIEHLCTRM